MQNQITLGQAKQSILTMDYSGRMSFDKVVFSKTGKGLKLISDFFLFNPVLILL